MATKVWHANINRHTGHPIRSENNHLQLIHSYALFTHFSRRLFEYQYERTGIVVL